MRAKLQRGERITVMHPRHVFRGGHLFPSYQTCVCRARVRRADPYCLTARSSCLAKSERHRVVALRIEEGETWVRGWDTRAAAVLRACAALLA